MSANPQSEADFASLVSSGGAKHLTCTNCSLPFSSENVYTREGWAETQISGICESCFDDMFENMEEDNG